MSKLDNPIFCLYLDVRGMASAKVGELTSQCYEKFTPILGEGLIIIQADKNTIELLWPGSNLIGDFWKNGIDGSLKDLIEKVNLSLSVIIGGLNNETLISNIRSMKIDKIGHNG